MGLITPSTVVISAGSLVTEAMMRVLLTANPQSGHWHPLVPFAEALRAAGHEVAFANTPVACAAISALGFPCFPAGADETAEDGQARRERQATQPGTDVSAASANLFAGVWAERRLPDLRAICAAWQPTILVRENLEFTGCIAAESQGLPHAVVQVTAWRPWFHPRLVAPLNRLRRRVGLPPDPDLSMLYRYLLLSPVPTSYQDPSAPLPPTAYAVRHVVFDRSGQESLPTWVGELPDRPVVYATMGTAFNRVGSILETIVAGLRDEPITLVVTTGRDQDPAAFGPQPSHVHLERYVPQSLLFPRCDLVVTHGGTGTVLTALNHGLPLVIVPVFSDQPDNARRCEQLGVAKVIAPGDRTPEAFRDAVRKVLGDPRYRRNAERLREEMAQLPGPEQVVGWLERLAAEKQPLVASP
jgi:UDP:flavonoid glycosyltransferase YjiC (YdhE family)